MNMKKTRRPNVRFPDQDKPPGPLRARGVDQRDGQRSVKRLRRAKLRLAQACLLSDAAFPAARFFYKRRTDTWHGCLLPGWLGPVRRNLGKLAGILVQSWFDVSQHPFFFLSASASASAFAFELAFSCSFLFFLVLSVLLIEGRNGIFRFPSPSPRAFPVSCPLLCSLFPFPFFLFFIWFSSLAPSLFFDRRYRGSGLGEKGALGDPSGRVRGDAGHKFRTNCLAAARS